MSRRKKDKDLPPVVQPSGAPVTNLGPQDGDPTRQPPPDLPPPDQKIDFSKQYIAGPGYAGPTFIDSYWALPANIDDAEEQYGTDLYTRMMHDPDISGVINVLKALILEEGVTILPKFTKPDDYSLRSPTEGNQTVLPGDPTREDQIEQYSQEMVDWQKSQELSDFGNRLVDRLARLDVPLTAGLWDMLESMTHGHKVGEFEFVTCQDGPDKGKTVWGSFMPKPRGAYTFVVDSVNRLYGITGIVPGRAAFVRQGLLGEVANLPSFVPMSKLMFLPFRMRDRDPRGTSILRGAYLPWKKEQIIHPEEVRFMGQAAGAKITATVGATASGGQLPGGSYEADPKAYLLKLLQYQVNGGVVVVDEGSDVDYNQPQSTGESFDRFFERQLRAKTRAILGSIRSFVEAQYGSKADSQQADDLLVRYIRAVRVALCAAVQRAIYNVLLMNFPAEDVDKYCPEVSMNRAQIEDFSKNSDAASKLVQSGVVTKPMRREICEKYLGLTFIQDDNEDDDDEDDSSATPLKSPSK